jgi:group II intron reverse transcriptase/maturase
MLGLKHSKLYAQLYSDDALTEAWRKVRLGTAIAGVDDVTVGDFEDRLFSNLKMLQDDLRQRRYTPQPVKRFYLTKDDGDKRPIGILTVRDRIVQRAILNVLSPIFDPYFEACSHGFRRGHSVRTAVAEVTRLVQQQHAWLVDLDIAAYFEHINTTRLYKAIKTRLRDRAFLQLIRAILDVETVVLERPGSWQRVSARGVLQGGILSALFANIYLDRFDKLALKQGLKLVRYGDDIIVCCRTKAEADEALKRVTKLLAKLDLQVNPRKTMIVHAEKGFYYLGEQLRLKTNKDGEVRLVGSKRPQHTLSVDDTPATQEAIVTSSTEIVEAE